jgi:hypothetical protein
MGNKPLVTSCAIAYLDYRPLGVRELLMAETGIPAGSSVFGRLNSDFREGEVMIATLYIRLPLALGDPGKSELAGAP